MPPPPSPKEENGLLSKVVKFVKNPTTSWADLDAQESDRESNYSKQMLKEMIERKRRNDFVRKREFDMLRKMRRTEVMSGTDPAARPSFFQSSMPSKPDDRASTLKKIDEIEAQMSMQWWKTKHGDASTRSASGAFPPEGATSPVPLPPARPPVTYAATEPARLPTVRSQQKTEPAPLAAQPPRPPAARPRPAAPPTPQGSLFPTVPAPAATDFSSAPTLPASLQSFAQPAPSAPMPVQEKPPLAFTPAPVPPPPAPLAPAVKAPAGAGSPDFPGGSSVFAVDADEVAHDPELEEASIRFANGDDVGAEAGLMEVLGPRGPRVNHEETWLTLFDLFRATGKQERFEAVAIEFAGRFGRSAPQWFSMPEAVGKLKAAPPGATPGAAADWTCPSTLGTQTLAALQAALGRAPQPWRLAWTKLVSIDEAAVEGLTRLFAQWSAQAVQLRFIAADNLEKVLRNATLSGDRNVNPARWQLRLEALRVMHRPDEFELVALDYCVTYEVSPPSWESARCECKSQQPDGSYAGNTVVGDAFRESMTSMLTGYGDSLSAPLSVNAPVIATVDLAGQIMSDATETLAMLEERMAGADVMVISCSQLIRIDFSAAGTLLNWVSARQGEGRQVQFVEVHRLVAAFFSVIGISEHARIVVRRD